MRSLCAAFVLSRKSVNDRPRASGSATSLDGRTSGKLKRMMNERTRVTVMTQLRPCHYIGCPTTYQTRHFFNNSKTNEDIETKQTHTTDTFLFISHTTNVFPFKSRSNIFIGVRIIKEMPGSVASGTSCITKH